jgi:hypothetical protein
MCFSAQLTCTWPKFLFMHKSVYTDWSHLMTQYKSLHQVHKGLDEQVPQMRLTHGTLRLMQ